MYRSNLVYYFKTSNVGYPQNSPFHPHTKYPEYPFTDFDEKENSMTVSKKTVLLLLYYKNINLIGFVNLFAYFYLSNSFIILSSYK